MEAQKAKECEEPEIVGKLLIVNDAFLDASGYGVTQGGYSPQVLLFRQLLVRVTFEHGTAFGMFLSLPVAMHLLYRSECHFHFIGITRMQPISSI